MVVCNHMYYQKLILVGTWGWTMGLWPWGWTQGWPLRSTSVSASRKRTFLLVTSSIMVRFWQTLYCLKALDLLFPMVVCNHVAPIAGPALGPDPTPDLALGPAPDLALGPTTVRATFVELTRPDICRNENAFFLKKSSFAQTIITNSWFIEIPEFIGSRFREPSCKILYVALKRYCWTKNSLASTDFGLTRI